MKTKITSFKDLIKTVKQGQPGRVAVVCADNDDVLQALSNASKDGFAKGFLIGNEKVIRDIAEKNDISLARFTVIPSSSPTQSALKALQLVKDGQADLIMKGNISTGRLLTILLDKERGIRGNKILSHVTAFSFPDQNCIKFLSDAAINIKPNCFDKIAICQNALKVAISFGYEKPKIALITPFEKVFLKEIPSTVDAALLAKMGERGQICTKNKCQIDGPISIDIALSSQAAKEKGYTGLIQGDADIFIVHDLEAGNVFYKALVYFTEAVVAGIVAGAKVPIILTSRADFNTTKHFSIAMGVYLAHVNRKEA